MRVEIRSMAWPVVGTSATTLSTVRLTVRTQAFHACNRGSIPLRCITSIWWRLIRFNLVTFDTLIQYCLNCIRICFKYHSLVKKQCFPQVTYDKQLYLHKIMLNLSLKKICLTLYQNAGFSKLKINILPKCQFLLPNIRFIHHNFKRHGNGLVKIYNSN